MRRERSISITWLAASLSLLACGSVEPAVCTEEARAGIVVEVLSMGTGAPIADGATLRLRDGDYVETQTQAFQGRSLAGAWERPGTYDVSVERADHLTWSVSGVVVTADECHVRPVHLTALLRSFTTD